MPIEHSLRRKGILQRCARDRVIITVAGRATQPLNKAIRLITAQQAFYCYCSAIIWHTARLFYQCCDRGKPYLLTLAKPPLVCWSRVGRFVPTTRPAWRLLLFHVSYLSALWLRYCWPVAYCFPLQAFMSSPKIHFAVSFVRRTNHICSDVSAKSRPTLFDCENGVDGRMRMHSRLYHIRMILFIF